MEMKYIKSAARLLDSNWVNKRGLDLSKEVLWVSVGQRGAELPAVKFGGVKKNSAAQTESNHTQVARVWLLDNGINLKVWKLVTLQPVNRGKYFSMIIKTIPPDWKGLPCTISLKKQILMFLRLIFLELRAIAHAGSNKMQTHDC